MVMMMSAGVAGAHLASSSTMHVEMGVVELEVEVVVVVVVLFFQHESQESGHSLRRNLPFLLHRTQEEIQRSYTRSVNGKRTTDGTRLMSHTHIHPAWFLHPTHADIDFFQDVL